MKGIPLCTLDFAEAVIVLASAVRTVPWAVGIVLVLGGLLVFAVAEGLVTMSVVVTTDLGPAGLTAAP